MHDERLKWWDAVAVHIVSYITFHSSSHSSFTLIPPSVSYFCVTVPSGFVSRSSICQHHPRGDRADEAQGRDIKRGMLALVLPHSISIWVAGPAICLRMIWSWLLQERNKGPPPMTNDDLRINTQVREGRRKRAESLFHHPSASVGLLINLWSLPLTLLWCLSLNCVLLYHSTSQIFEVIFYFLIRLGCPRNFN